MTNSVRPFALLAAALRLLDLRRVEERCYDRRGTDPDRDACFHKLGPPFFVAPIIVVAIGIAHSILTLGVLSRPYAERRQLERAVACGAV